MMDQANLLLTNTVNISEQGNGLTVENNQTVGELDGTNQVLADGGSRFSQDGMKSRDYRHSQIC